MASLAKGVVVEGDAVAVLRQGSRPVKQVVGNVALRRRYGATHRAVDGGYRMGPAAVVAVGSHLGVGVDVAVVVIGERTCCGSVHLVGIKAVEVVVCETLLHVPQIA